MTVSCAMHNGHIYLKKEDLMKHILEEQAAGWSADIVLKNLLNSLAKVEMDTVRWRREEE